MREAGYVPIPKEDYSAIALRRLQGDTLQAIADDYGVTRERIRQIALAAQPQVPKILKKVRSERREKEALEKISHEFILACQRALEEDRRCYTCGGWVLRGGDDIINCSPECSEAYGVLRSVDDPETHRRSVAQAILNNKDSAPQVRVAWAEAFMNGQKPERNRTYLVRGSRRAEIIRKYRPEIYEELMPEEDRRVHAEVTTSRGPVEIVRYARTGKWYFESDNEIRRITIVEAVGLIEDASQIFYGLPGGRTFDRLVRKKLGSG